MRYAIRTQTSWHALLISMAVALPLVLCLADADADAPPEAHSETIAVEELMASPFAQYFQADDYAQALAALQPLLTRYPDDPLLIRYQAMTLDRLGRSQEAITIYQRLLTQSPDHLPTRFFLGEAYERAGQQQQAKRAWELVRQHSAVPAYRQWATEALARLQVQTPPDGAPRRKRWTLIGNMGWDFDTNVTLKPKDKSLARSGDQNAGRFALNLTLRYRAIERRDTRVDLLLTTRQSLHDDSLDDVNFTSQEFGVDARRRLHIGGQDVIARGRYNLRVGFLESDIFSLANRFLTSLETRFTPHTRTVLANQFTVSDFGRDGSNPSQTSRDGQYNDLSLTQYLYSDDFSRYVYVRQEYNMGWTRGGNFDRRGSTTRLGMHTPLVWRTDADLSTQLSYQTYPHFTSRSSLDTARRRDTTWNVSAALTHYITPRLGVRVQYRWVNALNRNDLFEYNRHIAGVHLLFSQSF